MHSLDHLPRLMLVPLYFSNITRANYFVSRGAQGESMAEVEFKASRVVQTAEENRRVNIIFPVILYLGEKSPFYLYILSLSESLDRGRGEAGSCGK